MPDGRSSGTDHLIQRLFLRALTSRSLQESNPPSSWAPPPSISSCADNGRSTPGCRRTSPPRTCWRHHQARMPRPPIPTTCPSKRMFDGPPCHPLTRHPPARAAILWAPDNTVRDTSMAAGMALCTRSIPNGTSTYANFNAMIESHVVVSPTTPDSIRNVNFDESPDSGSHSGLPPNQSEAVGRPRSCLTFRPRSHPITRSR